MRPVRIIIAGGRDYNFSQKDFDRLDDILEGILERHDIEDVEVVCGMAKGADTGGKKWGESIGLHVEKFPAEWENLEADLCRIKIRGDGTKYNALAGFARNEQMAGYATMLVAFPGGRGTTDMISRAEEHGLEVIEIEE